MKKIRHYLLNLIFKIFFALVCMVGSVLIAFLSVLDAFTCTDIAGAVLDFFDIAGRGAAKAVKDAAENKTA